MRLTDSLGRQINYLRLSVTDRCNMRCFYCMPREGIVKKQHDALLSYEELLLIAETAVAMGIEKIRITGGEPLVRRGIVGFSGEAGSNPRPQASGSDHERPAAGGDGGRSLPGRGAAAQRQPRFPAAADLQHHYPRR